MLSEVDALLERLVSQFASPYDFLRELVQNAMDAGADRAEVTLAMHPAGDDPDEVVFELSVVDTGSGMDEAVIDGELTRLFGTSKEGDRSMAGGFGIGFVSVFAWEPERVLVQTGRAGEAWELLFHTDRRFEKVPVDQPVEGTAVHLFRRGRAGERSAVAEAVRDALWRWCRFAPVEVTFEDLGGDLGPELVQDAPEPEVGELTLAWSEGETHIHLAFDVPDHAVLLRHGLVLEEGSPAQLFPTLASQAPGSLRHLRARVDSPRLRTTLARDKVVDDDGRSVVERLVTERLGELRERLVSRLEALAGAGAEWDHGRHRDLAHLHAHLALERPHVPDLAGRAVLRTAAGEAISPTALAKASPGGTCVCAPPGPPSAVVDLALRARISTVVAAPEDRGWLDPLLLLVGVRAVASGSGLSRVEDAADARALAQGVEAAFRGAEHPTTSVRVGSFVDATDPRAPLWGAELHGGNERDPALVAFDPPGRPGEQVRALWLNREHPAVAAALRLWELRPHLATACVALFLGAEARGEGRVDAAELAAALEEVRV